jgi:sulfoacetaldehyde dehydrogenase
VAACEVLIGYIHAEFDKIGEDKALVSMVPGKGSKEKTQRLLEISDVIVVTGSQNNVKRAYTSGTPALAVGAGNVTVIVDETADLADAAQKITASKTFDNATSCSSENALVVVDAIYDDFMAALAKEGGYKAPDEAAIVRIGYGPDHARGHQIPAGGNHGHWPRSSAVRRKAEPCCSALPCA